jgi:transposase-like protein
MMKQLEKDLLELLSLFCFARPLWRKLRTTIVNEHCFVNMESVDRIVYAILNRFNQQRKNRTFRLFIQAA